MIAPRYEALVKLASGGMATVWIGTARGALGFRQLVAIKKPHPHLLEQAGFREELIAEARLASMIRHANVVDVRDVEEDGDSISLVMDYIEGASLGDLLVVGSKRNLRLPPRVAVRIMRDACAGLNAAHELVDEKGRHVGLVHRDVSPQNILVGEDGIARVTDFGVAKFARKNMQSTSAGSLKGKLAYMAPEYLRSEPIDRRCDVFAAGIVLWEALTGQRCFRGENEPETFRRILEMTPPAVSSIVPELAPLDDVVATALEKSVNARFQNTAAMGAALETAANEAGLIGSHTEVAATLKNLVGAILVDRRERVRAKLSDEPSLASMGGEVVMSPVTEAAPATEPSTFVDPMEATRTSDAIALTASPNTPPMGANGTAGATLGMPVTPRAAGVTTPIYGMTPNRDFTQPVTASSYEVESRPIPKKPLPIVALILGGIVLAGLAIAGGVSLGRASGVPAPSTSPIPSAALSSPPVALPAPVPELASAPPAPTPTPSARPTVPTKPTAAPKPSPAPVLVPAAPSASTKRPPANPYE